MAKGWGDALQRRRLPGVGGVIVSRASCAPDAAATLQVLGEGAIKVHGRWLLLHRPVHSLCPQGSYVPSSQEER